VSSPIGFAVASVSILPILVFLAETCVVTLSTVRTIFVTRGMKELAALLGFFEISIWLFAIAQVMQNLNSPSCYVAFAGGFSLGNFLGVLIERRLALGTVAVRVTTQNDAGALIRTLRTADCGVTTIDAQGDASPLRIISMTIRRRDLDHVIEMVRCADPEAFYSVHDVQQVAAQQPKLFIGGNGAETSEHQPATHVLTRSPSAKRRMRTAA
jgi:uncharacterized protein YebE (UPF0316 family)